MRLDRLQVLERSARDEVSSFCDVSANDERIFCSPLLRTENSVRNVQFNEDKTLQNQQPLGLAVRKAESDIDNVFLLKSS